MFGFLPVYNADFGSIWFRNAEDEATGRQDLYYYKTDGILPGRENMDSIRKRIWKSLEGTMPNKGRQQRGNYRIRPAFLQYVKYEMNIWKTQLGYVTEALIACLNNFIRRHSKELKIYEFEMKTELDYCMFSALKTIKTWRVLIRCRKTISRNVSMLWGEGSLKTICFSAR